jgi:hypothetical protein
LIGTYAALFVTMASFLTSNTSPGADFLFKAWHVAVFPAVLLAYIPTNSDIGESLMFVAPLANVILVLAALGAWTRLRDRVRKSV